MAIRRKISGFMNPRIRKHSTVGKARGHKWYQRMPVEDNPDDWEIVNDHLRTHNKLVLTSVRVDGLVTYRVFSMEKMAFNDVQREHSASSFVPRFV
jgi:hypothetical protein